MTVGEQLEYEKLNTEIQNTDKRQMEVLAFIFTVSIALIGYASSTRSPLICLIPLLVIAPGQLLILHCFQMSRRMATYIRCFLETGADSPRYETRILAFRALPGKHYRSLVYNAQYASVQVLAATCLLLVLVQGGTTERVIASVATCIWGGFAVHVHALYRYLASGGGADMDYFEDWRRVRDLEMQSRNGPTVGNGRPRPGGDAR